MNAAIYARVARPSGMNLARQRERCEEYAREHTLTVACTYTDTGGSWEGLIALLDEAAEQSTTDLIVASLDRLGRDAATSGRTRAAISDAGITLHAVREDALMANPFVRRIMLELARIDCDANDYRSDPTVQG